MSDQDVQFAVHTPGSGRVSTPGSGHVSGLTAGSGHVSGLYIASDRLGVTSAGMPRRLRIVGQDEPDAGRLVVATPETPKCRDCEPQANSQAVVIRTLESAAIGSSGTLESFSFNLRRKKGTRLDSTSSRAAGAAKGTRFDSLSSYSDVVIHCVAVFPPDVVVQERLASPFSSQSNYARRLGERIPCNKHHGPMHIRVMATPISMITLGGQPSRWLTSI